MTSTRARWWLVAAAGLAVVALAELHDRFRRLWWWPWP